MLASVTITAMSCVPIPGGEIHVRNESEISTGLVHSLPPTVTVMFGTHTVLCAALGAKYEPYTVIREPPERPPRAGTTDDTRVCGSTLRTNTLAPPCC